MLAHIRARNRSIARVSPRRLEREDGVLRWVLEMLKSTAGRRIIVALKVAVSVALISLLLWTVEWERVIGSLATARWSLVALTFAVFAVQFPLSAYKWQHSLRAHGLEHRFGFLLRAICVGFFFNNFLPSSIGGDGYRVIKTLPAQGMKSRALSAVVLERLVGLSALLAIGFAAGVLLLTRSPSALVGYFVASIGAAIAAAIAMGLLTRVGALRGIWSRLARVRKLAALTENVTLIARSGRHLAMLVLLSFLFQALAVLGVWSLFRALSEPIDAASSAVVGAVAAVVAVLPISINGIGVTEGSFVAAAVELGVDVNHAVVAAFLSRALVLPLSVVCGLVYLSGSRGGHRDVRRNG